MICVSAFTLGPGCLVKIEDVQPEVDNGGMNSGSLGGSASFPQVGGAGGETAGGEAIEIDDMCWKSDHRFQDDFQKGADCWEPSPKSQFSVVTDDLLLEGAQVYEQPESYGFPRIAFVGGDEASFEDVKVEARVRILDWGSDEPGVDDIVGLFVRYQNEQNFYYLGLLGNDKLYARRRVAGGNGSVGSSLEISQGWELDRWYHIELSIEGKAIRFSVDGGDAQVVEDESLTGAGAIGIGTYANATARFDDVIVTKL